MTTPNQSGFENNGDKEALLKDSEMELYNQMQFSVIPKIPLFWGGFLLPAGVHLKPRQQGLKKNK